MNIDPKIVSLVALVVSVVSLILSVYNVGVDRRLQLEHLRGEIRVYLTSRGVDVLSMIDALRQEESTKKHKLVAKLIDIAKGLVDVRERLQVIQIPFFVTASLFIKFRQIKADVEDAEPVINSLRQTVEKGDLARAMTIANGLLERIYGHKGKGV